MGAMKKRERTWQDEVKDRVRHRRQRKAGGAELPLFDEPPVSAEPSRPVPSEPEVRDRPQGDAPAPEGDLSPEREEGLAPEETRLLSPTEGDLEDLPLRPAESGEEAGELEAEPAPRHARAHVPPLVDDEYAPEEEPRDGAEEWLELPSKAPEARPVERPALPLERLQAAAVDLALLIGIWTVVVYFASRAAHVTLASLRPSWPWLLGYLAFLGLVYASYFTGTTGQTLGKMVTGLRVLHASSRPPGYLRAFLRAGAGALGILSVGLGQLPMMFDPARRALHDRLFGTRVVKN
jgi:uncharacterized RDD family membrane protein YckC